MPRSAGMRCPSAAAAKLSLRINRVNYGKQCVEKPALAAGGAAFYDGISEAPEDVDSS